MSLLEQGPADRQIPAPRLADLVDHEAIVMDHDRRVRTGAAAEALLEAVAQAGVGGAHLGLGELLLAVDPELHVPVRTRIGCDLSDA